MGRNVWMCFVSRVSTNIALNALEILMPSVDSVDIYSIDGMVEKPSVSTFQNFLRIENWLNIKKVMGRNVWMCFVSTVSTYIALNALEILMPSVDSVNIYSIYSNAIVYCVWQCIECYVMKTVDTLVFVLLYNTLYRVL